MISTDYFWFRECPICDGQGRLIIKKNIDSNKLFLCCDECMSCWENEDDLTQQKKKIYGIFYQVKDSECFRGRY